MAITRTPMIDDDGTGTTGTILNNAWKQELYGQIDAFVGPWIDVPFSATDFGGVPPLTWTVGAAAIQRHRYCLINKVLHWSIYVSWFSGGNALSGSPGTTLLMKVPGGLSMAANQSLLVDYCAGIAGTPTGGGLIVGPYGDGTKVTITKTDSSNFALTDVPGIIFTVVLEVL